jgi:serine/threonine protein kinase
MSRNTEALCARQGCTWDWNSPDHLGLAPQLLRVLQRVHDLGIRHGDLPSGNILVTPDAAVFLLDFESCSLAAPSEDLEEEQSEMAYMLSMRPHVRSSTYLLLSSPRTAASLQCLDAVGRNHPLSACAAALEASAASLRPICEELRGSVAVCLRREKLQPLHQ